MDQSITNLACGFNAQSNDLPASMPFFGLWHCSPSRCLTQTTLHAAFGSLSDDIVDRGPLGHPNSRGPPHGLFLLLRLHEDSEEFPSRSSPGVLAADLREPFASFAGRSPGVLLLFCCYSAVILELGWSMSSKLCSARIHVLFWLSGNRCGIVLTPRANSCLKPTH